MLDIQVTIVNDKVVIERLTALMQIVPDAVDRGLQSAAKGVYSKAFEWLGGPSGGLHYVESKRGFVSQRRTQYNNAGDYPVPIRTGNLRRLLNWLGPSESKSGDAGTFTAGRHETIIYDSASYARAVFLGRGSSEKFGPRNALRDGLKVFNAGGGIKKAIEDEIKKELKG